MVNLLVTKLSPLTDIGDGKTFTKNFTCFGGLVPKSRPFLIDVEFLCFFSLLKIHTEIIKVTKVYLIKFGGLHCGAILSKSLKNQKLFSSLQSRA